jgi:DNA-binding response OmpR family regulator
MAKILLAEDDPALGLVLQNLLSEQNHQLDIAEDGEYAIELLLNYAYDLAILDCDLPKLPGLEICKRYRSHGGKIPVLFLTGRTDFDSRVAGLDSGGDDYMCKPFNAPELMARVRALLRRVQVESDVSLKVGRIIFEPATKKVTFDGRTLSLVRKEMAILEFLMRNADHPFSAEVIVERVWPSESDVSPESIRPYIKRLRDKLTDDTGKSPLVTVHGYGYKLSSDV